MKFVLTGTTENGKAVPHNRGQFVEAFNFFEGKQWLLKLEEVKSYRSYLQNNYLWGAVYPPITRAFNERGYRYTDEMTHGHLADMFLRIPILSEQGEIIGHRTRSTTKLTTKEFSELYLEQIYQFAAEEFSLVIPPPDKEWRKTNTKPT